MKAVIFNLEGTLLAPLNGGYELYDGVEELLAILTRLGVAIVAHADASDPAARHLFSTPIYKNFSAFTYSPGATEANMHPGQPRKMLGDLHIATTETLLVGNNVADIFAGKHAGFAKVVAITHGQGNVAELRAAGADHIIDNIPALLDVVE